jgi:cation transport ATPase
LLNMQTESFELQTTLNNKLNTLEQARTAEKQAEIDKQAAAQKAADEAATKDSLAEQKKREQLEKNHQQAIQELRMAAVGGTFSMLKNLNTAFEKDTEEGQKKAFNRNKAISIAETLVSTYSAAQKAYASQLSVPTPDAPIRAQIAAGIAVAAGLAKVAAIKSQQFSGGSGGGAAAGGGGMPSGGTESVGVDVGSLVPNQQTPTPEPVRAYVVENEISNKQALNKELQIQTTL